MRLELLCHAQCQKFLLLLVSVILVLGTIIAKNVRYSFMVWLSDFKASSEKREAFQVHTLRFTHLEMPVKCGCDSEAVLDEAGPRVLASSVSVPLRSGTVLRGLKCRKLKGDLLFQKSGSGNTKKQSCGGGSCLASLR